MRRARTVRVLVSMAIIGAGVQGIMMPSSADDVEIKASFIWNFVRMVNWKTPAHDNPSDELRICSLTSSDISTALRSLVRNKTVGTRTVSAVVEVNPLPSRCQVLVVEHDDYLRIAPVLNRLRGTPVLTVGNGHGFLEIGGMFELTIENRRVVFDANISSIKESGLDVSARLLRLSKSLRTGAGDAY